MKNKKKQKNTTQYVLHILYYTQANTNNVNKTWSLLQTTGGKDEPYIVFMWTSQHRTQNVNTHNRTTQIEVDFTAV